MSKTQKLKKLLEQNITFLKIKKDQALCIFKRKVSYDIFLNNFKNLDLKRKTHIS